MKTPAYKEHSYFYDNQLKDYIIQFMAVFTGFKVRIGKNDSGSQTDFIKVPIRYGSADRVVAAIMADNTTNTPIRLPAFAATLLALELAPEKRKGVGATTRYTRFPRGGSFPDDLKVIEMMQPIPYNAIFELNVMCSNTDQHLQLMEQILMMFDPILQLQMSDDPDNWKRISMLELNTISFDEQIPAGTEGRVITSKLTFVTTVYLAPPTKIRSNFIKSIKLRMDLLEKSDDIHEIINDITRTVPDYETLIDVDELDLPTE